jgi:hypothetical protein
MKKEPKNKKCQKKIRHRFGKNDVGIFFGNVIFLKNSSLA